MFSPTYVQCIYTCGIEYGLLEPLACEPVNPNGCLLEPCRGGEGLFLASPASSEIPKNIPSTLKKFPSLFLFSVDLNDFHVGLF
jgi:hypothetical protein